MLQSQEELAAFLNCIFFLLLLFLIVLLYKNLTFSLDCKVLYDIGKWVAVKKSSKQWYPGEVVDTSDNEIEVSGMGIIGENKLAWPENDDVCWYKNSDIICSIESLTPVSLRVFGFCREDLAKVKELV